ncbi:hypothetical protein Amsp01_048880 [Amycolatopsis sp. NBRC 101858]|uniref:hypothetical protein n=1 Tax=Amycolatopsis sp. NBRC 101858 TaxID=3032200 RepID=UPI0024A03BE1|nr:hypothetical protein [Amycolatopsis sp. NBRC 101858]GLY38864.1 hypothetical protein Amsp01_048880 [Amycolatopsis sp. NBRC 101858]
MTATEAIEVLAEHHEADADDRHRRVVTVDNKDNGERIRLRAPLKATVESVIERMYAEFRLTRHPLDRLICRGKGEDVFPLSALSLERYLHQGHCPNLHWSFAGDTGGA